MTGAVAGLAQTSVSKVVKHPHLAAAKQKVLAAARTVTEAPPVSTTRTPGNPLMQTPCRTIADAKLLSGPNSSEMRPTAQACLATLGDAAPPSHYTQFPAFVDSSMCT